MSGTLQPLRDEEKCSDLLLNNKSSEINESCDKKPKMDNSKNHVNKGTNYQKIVQTEPGNNEMNV